MFKNVFRQLATSLLFSMVGVLPTYGAVIDFTDDSVGFSGSLGTINWALSANVGVPNTNEIGPGNFGILVGDNDGVGIGDDEVSFGGEYLTLSFDQTVKLTASYFLDLYIAPSGLDREVAHITVGTAPGASDASVEADDLFQNDFGYRELLGLSLIGTNFTFWVASSNDDQGVPDYALAAVEISPIPIPISILLFGSAFSFFGGIRLFNRQRLLFLE